MARWVFFVFTWVRRTILLSRTCESCLGSVGMWSLRHVLLTFPTTLRQNFKRNTEHKMRHKFRQTNTPRNSLKNNYRVQSKQARMDQSLVPQIFPEKGFERRLRGRQTAHLKTKTARSASRKSTAVLWLVGGTTKTNAPALRQHYQPCFVIQAWESWLKILVCRTQRNRSFMVWADLDNHITVNKTTDSCSCLKRHRQMVRGTKSFEKA